MRLLPALLAIVVVVTLADLRTHAAGAAKNKAAAPGKYQQVYGDTGKEPELDAAKELPRYPAVEPKDAPGTFQIKKGFKLEFAAHEPQVVDPIAISFDERGRMFVVEMIDYSERHDETPHPGRIRMLEDKDGDGYFETATVFADNLAWPTAVICYGGGIFIAATPDLLWLKDTNGDGRADDRKVVFTGFGTSRDKLNVQALINSFQWGLDNRIHGATGPNGGVVTAMNHPSMKPLDLRGRDFSFDPRTLSIQAEAGGGQYGMSFDSRGRKFVCSNSDHLQMLLYDDRYAARNPYYSMPPSRRSIAADGGAAEVFRISPDEPWRIVRTRWRISGVVKGAVEGGGRVSGYFTGATGTTVYRGDAYGPEFVDNTFTGDAGGGLVHRKILYPDGVGFIGRRPADEQNFEFLASRDTWFRPVNFANAPDGCLYVLDMYREVIEHPWSLPESIKQHLDLNSGNDRGRIYRIAPEKFQRRPKFDLGQATTAELVATLEHSNGWQRDTAARLLYERQDKAAVELLTQTALNGRSALGRLHALCALDGLRPFDGKVVMAAVHDSDAAVRERAILLAEKEIKSGAVGASMLEALAKLSTDPDPRVRYQLAFTLGEIRLPGHTTALAEVARRDGGDPQIAAAVLSAPPEVTGDLFGQLTRDEKFAKNPAGEGFLRQLVQIIGSKNHAPEIALVLEFLTAQPSPALVGAFGDGLQRAGSSLAKADKEGKLKSVFTNAAKAAADTKTSESGRAQAIALLGLTSFKESSETLATCLRAGQPEPVQLAAIAALGHYSDAGVSAPLLKNWPDFSPRARSEALRVLLARPDRALALVDALRSGAVKRDLLNATQIEALQHHKDKKVAALAAKVLPLEKKVSRNEAVQQFSAALTLKGDATKGRAIYAERCVSCHRAEGQGFALGPDLVTVKATGREKLLLNLLDPNKEVAPQYLAYNVETKDGESYAGLIASDNASGVTLRQAFGKEDLIPRAKIKSMRSPGQSLMPEGLEAGLTPQQVADLLEFIEGLK